MHKKQIEIPQGKRVNYTYGMVLGVDDFRQEFSYLSRRMKLHNRMVHGYGTVSGLEVSSEHDLSTGILVSGGVAIDPLGNEIVLPSDVRCPFPDTGEILYLVLSWAERETDPIPLPGGGEGDVLTAPSRVEEYAILQYEPDPSNCKPPGITLARLKKVRGRWKLDKKFRPRQARV